jgi:hypothetical protein
MLHEGELAPGQITAVKPSLSWVVIVGARTTWPGVTEIRMLCVNIQASSVSTTYTTQ